MEKKRQHDAFIAAERSEFELGKKHLANMMGREQTAADEADDMTQSEIDSAIEYLFPAGLSEPLANPMMRPPEEIFPASKDAEFDFEGRPFSPFFYTGQANFVRAMYDVVENIENCIFLSDRMFAAGKRPEEAKALNEAALAGTRWMTRDELAAKLEEDVQEVQYEDFINALERLLFQNFSYKFKDFLFDYRVEVAVVRSKTEFIEPTFNEDDNRARVEAFGRRNTACAKVKVIKPGTGKIAIRHIDYPDQVFDITYFYGLKERMQIVQPLLFTKLLGLVDVEAVVDAGGAASQAGAIRYATSICLKSFVDADMIEDMTLCGLLTQDIRVKERKIPGQEGARRKFTWKKR